MFWIVWNHFQNVSGEVTKNIFFPSDFILPCQLSAEIRYVTWCDFTAASHCLQMDTLSSSRSVFFYIQNVCVCVCTIMDAAIVSELQATNVAQIYSHAALFGPVVQTYYFTLT